MNGTQTPPRRFVLTFADRGRLPGGPSAYRRLARLLKYAGRALGFRCIGAEELDQINEVNDGQDDDGGER